MANDYDEALGALSEAEPFDPDVFAGDDTCPQALCNLMLALALVFNDFKDSVLGYRLVLEQFPADQDHPSKELGHAGGMGEHLYRLLMGVIHEALELLEKNRKVLAEPYLQRIVTKLHPDAKKAWNILTAVQVGAKSKDPVARLVHYARNKVAFHYDARAIAAGFRSFVATSRQPYISYGPSMAATRFYFADAAAQQLTRDESDPQIVNDFFSGKLSIFENLNHAVREVVGTFVRLRLHDLRRKKPPSNSA